MCLYISSQGLVCGTNLQPLGRLPWLAMQHLHVFLLARCSLSLSPSNAWGAGPVGAGPARLRHWGLGWWRGQGVLLQVGPLVCSLSTSLAQCGPHMLEREQISDQLAWPLGEACHGYLP